MITNKDIRVENGFLIINGDKFPLDGQSPETIMDIVEDNSDTTPTENSTAPITSGGVFTALGTKQDTLTFDTAPTDESTNPVTSGGVYTAIGGRAPAPAYDSFSGTTDANGNLATTISVNQVRLISAICTTNNSSVTFYNTSGNLGFHVIDATTGSPIANASVEIRYNIMPY